MNSANDDAPCADTKILASWKLGDAVWVLTLKAAILAADPGSLAHETVRPVRADQVSAARDTDLAALRILHGQRDTIGVLLDADGFPSEMRLHGLL